MPRPSNPDRRFIEIVNWTKAQPSMPDKDATWMKLYTSLLDCHQFRQLDDAGRLLIIGLWLYATQKGRHVFPADPQWIWEHIPMLRTKPKLRPLLEAKDEYGDPAPFIRIVDKTGIYNVRNSKSKKREREETKSKTEPLRAPEKKREKKERTRSRPAAQQEQTSTDQRTGPEQGQKPVQPANPAKSEAGGPAVPSRAPAGPTMAPKALRPAYQGEPQPIGTVIHSIEHWYDENAKAFGYEIFDALSLHKIGDSESKWGKSERGTFTKWLHNQPNPAAARLHGLQVAKNIAKEKSPRKPGAVWRAIMSGQTRAPPQQKTA